MFGIFSLKHKSLSIPEEIVKKSLLVHQGLKYKSMSNLDFSLVRTI